AESFAHLTQLIKERIEHYNYERYHSALGYVTPFTKYRGDPESQSKTHQKELGSSSAGARKDATKRKNDSEIRLQDRRVLT
ncbi:MAG: hypothetical protein AMJ42_02845, partial [Deltaproteobacteria bacterium DG_8]